MSKQRIHIEDLSKTDFGSVPEGYFDELPNKIWAKITENEAAQIMPLPVKTKPWWRQWALAAAASIVLVVGSILFFYQKSNNTQPDMQHISQSDVLQYVNNNSEDFDEIDHIQLVQNTDVDQIIHQNLPTQINNTHIEQLEDEIY
jgi:negative regulator of sigma E activity